MDQLLHWTQSTTRLPHALPLGGVSGTPPRKTQLARRCIGQRWRAVCAKRAWAISSAATPPLAPARSHSPRTAPASHSLVLPVATAAPLLRTVIEAGSVAVPVERVCQEGLRLRQSFSPRTVWKRAL